LMFACILELQVDLIADLPVSVLRNANSAGLSNPLQAGCDVYTITEQVLPLDHHITQVNSYPELDPLLGRHVCISAVHSALYIHSAAHRVHHGRKLDQNAITCGLNDPAAMEGHGRVDQLAAKLAEALERAFLVNSSQPRIARHVGGQDGGKLAGRGHGPSRSA